jgi:hypothetical protein
MKVSEGTDWFGGIPGAALVAARQGFGPPDVLAASTFALMIPVMAETKPAIELVKLRISDESFMS